MSNARTMRSRNCSEQCRSAAAATRIGVSSIGRYLPTPRGSANAASGYDAAVGYTPSENLPRSCRHDEARVRRAGRRGRARDARRRPRDMGEGRPPDRPRCRLLSTRARRGSAPRRSHRNRDDVLVPPEGWLLKAHDGEILVDLIYRPAGGPIGDEHFERATAMELMAQPVLVASIDDVLSTKLMALTEQEPDFRAVLEIARSLREQIDWGFVRRQTAPSPFAAAFFTLVESLGIAPPSGRVARSPRPDRCLHTPAPGRIDDMTDPRTPERLQARTTRPSSSRQRVYHRAAAVAARGRAAASRRYRSRARRASCRHRGRAGVRRHRRRRPPGD